MPTWMRWCPAASDALRAVRSPPAPALPLTPLPRRQGPLATAGGDLAPRPATLRNDRRHHSTAPSTLVPRPEDR